MEQEKRDLSKLSKAELLEEARALQDRLDEVKREEKFAGPAKDIAAMKRAFIAEGFTESEAMSMIMAAVGNATKGSY